MFSNKFSDRATCAAWVLVVLPVPLRFFVRVCLPLGFYGFVAKLTQT
jgi:hypothetical protein